MHMLPQLARSAYSPASAELSADPAIERVEA